MNWTSRPKPQRDELPDHDAQAPGGEDRIQRTLVERPDDELFGNAAEEAADDEGKRQRQPGIEAEARDDDGAIGADGQPCPMGEIDDLQHAENGEQARGDDEKHGRGGDDIEHEHRTALRWEAGGNALSRSRLLTRSEVGALGARIDVLEGVDDRHRAVCLHLAEIHVERCVVLLVH